MKGVLWRPPTGERTWLGFNAPCRPAATIRRRFYHLPNGRVWMVQCLYRWAV